MRSDNNLPGVDNASAGIRVAIVDMDRRVRTALAGALRVAGLDVIGTTGEPGNALRLAARGAQVLVMDPRLPDLTDGRALVETIARDWPHIRVVIMGWGEAGESRLDNAAAFVTKSARPEEFVAATLVACGC